MHSHNGRVAHIHCKFGKEVDCAWPETYYNLALSGIFFMLKIEDKVSRAFPGIGWRLRTPVALPDQRGLLQRLPRWHRTFASS